MNGQVESESLLPPLWHTQLEVHLFSQFYLNYIEKRFCLEKNTLVKRSTKSGKKEKKETSLSDCKLFLQNYLIDSDAQLETLIILASILAKHDNNSSKLALNKLKIFHAYIFIRTHFIRYCINGYYFSTHKRIVYRVV